MAVMSSRLVAVPPTQVEKPVTSRITSLEALNRPNQGETAADRSVKSLSSVLAQMSKTAQPAANKKAENTSIRLKEVDASEAAAKLTRATLFENRSAKRDSEVAEISVLLAVLG